MHNVGWRPMSIDDSINATIDKNKAHFGFFTHFHSYISDCQIRYVKQVKYCCIFIQWKILFKFQGSPLSSSSGLTVEFEEPEITRYIGKTFQNKTIFTARLDLGPNLEKIDSQQQAFLYEKGRRQVNDNSNLNDTRAKQLLKFHFTMSSRLFSSWH